MQAMAFPIAAPGCCKLCGTADSNRGPYVDTGWSEEFYGAVYFCRECSESIITLIGATSVQAADKLRTEIAELKEQVFHLERENRLLSELRELLNEYFNWRGLRASAQPASYVPADLESEAAQKSTGQSVPSAGKTARPSNVKGSTDVPSISPDTSPTPPNPTL